MKEFLKVLTRSDNSGAINKRLLDLEPNTSLQVNEKGELVANAGGFPMVVLTQGEYDELDPPQAGTLYFIKEDEA